MPATDCSALGEQVAGQHYKGLPIQPAEYCQRNRLPYCESSVVRYVTRHREKNGREDIEKAIHCLQLLLEIEYPKNKSVLDREPSNDEIREIIGGDIPTSRIEELRQKLS